MFFISEDSINGQKLHAEMINKSAGALVVFEGLVRDTNQGHDVISLEYQAYIEMAEIEGQKILAEVKQKFNIIEAKAVHRVGHLQLTDCAICIGVTAKHRDDGYKASRYIIDQIKLRLPIWKKEHYLNKTPEWVYCKDHLHHVHLCSKEYFSNQNKVFSNDALKDKKVAIVGMGGLGCPLSMSLATSGLGHLKIIDGDIVEVSNLHRQFLYDQNSIGEFKVIEAARKLILMSPFCQIEAIKEFLNENNQGVLSDVDMILDCTDNLATKNYLKLFAYKTKKPLISAGIYRRHAYLRSYIPDISLDFKFDHQEQDTNISREFGCSDSGMFSSWVNIIGHLQATQVIDYFLYGKNATTQEEMHFDFESFDLIKFSHQQKNEERIQW